MNIAKKLLVGSRGYTEKNGIEEYIKNTFPADLNLEPFMESLREQGVLDKKNILDVGCGPGRWTFAAAKLNPAATVIGVDTHEKFLNFAAEYMQNEKIKNCKFLNESYENLLQHFSPASFDVIICNSVIQYINEEKAVQILSYLLKKGGILLMFWNHGPGYHLKGLFSAIQNLEFMKISYNIIVLTSNSTIVRILLNLNQYTHFVTFKNLKKNQESLA